MGLLKQLTPGQIVALVVGLGLAFCGAVNTVGAAVERIIKLRQAVKAPNAAQDERLEKLERRMDDAERKLGQDFAAFREQERATAVLQQGVLALLGHGLHGNNVNQMVAAETALTEYLTNHH